MTYQFDDVFMWRSNVKGDLISILRDARGGGTGDFEVVAAVLQVVYSERCGGAERGSARRRRPFEALREGSSGDGIDLGAERVKEST